MTSLFDQTVNVQRATGAGTGNQLPEVTGTVAAADTATILALAKEGVTVAFLIYTTIDPLVNVGDHLALAGATYPVVAPTRPFVNRTAGMSVYVTPCGAKET